ncbi:MAG TPA: hypothetical protein VII38_16230 [Polyangia bacterium]
MRSSVRVGLVAILLVTAIATAAWFLEPPPSVRYAGSRGAIEAMVSLRTGGSAPPEKLTVDLGGGVRIVATRLR